MKYQVPVRTLTEFTARRGDLDLRFTPSPSALEGIAGHAVVAGRRAAGYQTEVSLVGEYQHLVVRGRADGYDAARNLLEEIKTFRGDLGTMPDNHRHLHWAQVKMYGWLMCQKLCLAEIRLALVYFDIGAQKETVIEELHAADTLREFFEQQCERFLNWAEQEMAHREARNASLVALRFPHAAFRAGQRELAEAVYRSGTGGRTVMAQAPTGIGKTIGTLFPLLKACPGQDIDKLFFLAAKTSGRGLALEALRRIREGDTTPSLRIVELVARDKACEHPDKACHGESCPLARGFYDRLPQARQEAVQVPMLDRATLRAVALNHQICPYYLSQDLARWSDVVVGDYNYYFDSSAMLHAMTMANQWRVGLLVDEAHNLVDRARGMYTAALDQDHLRLLRKSVPTPLKKPIERLNRSWNALRLLQHEDYQVHPEIPEKLLFALLQASTAITDFLSDNPTHVDSRLQNFYFDLLHFSRMAEVFGDHSLFDVTNKEGGGSVLCLRNIIPAPFLKSRFADAHCTTLFSATLNPWHYYRDMLGLPDDTICIDVASPFRAEQLSVRVVSQISTRYQDRSRSLEPIADLIARQYREAPGNYLAFFSSFDYLQQVTALFQARHDEIPIWEQSRRMDEAQRDAFLARFAPGGSGVGFAVLGGPFAEGIDLPGDRLVGAFIATLGLPQLNPMNEQIRERMEKVFGAGYAYTYLYPGLQKVVQAAGRVIRTQTDRGVAYLIDDRFSQRDIQALMPGWWQVDGHRLPEGARSK